MRRRIEPRLLSVREQFERLVEEWVPDDDLQQAWREHLRNRAPAPSEPPSIRPLAFRGISDAGSVAEVLGKPDEELAVVIDGSLAERIVAAKDLASKHPFLGLRLDDIEFLETFTASDDALEAVEDFLAEGESPPWEYAPELLADGLIDTHFALTPRGRRALARRAA